MAALICSLVTGIYHTLGGCPQAVLVIGWGIAGIALPALLAGLVIWSIGFVKHGKYGTGWDHVPRF